MSSYLVSMANEVFPVVERHPFFLPETYRDPMVFFMGYCDCKEWVGASAFVAGFKGAYVREDALKTVISPKALYHSLKQHSESNAWKKKDFPFPVWQERALGVIKAYDLAYPDGNIPEDVPSLRDALFRHPILSFEP